MSASARLTRGDDLSIDAFLPLVRMSELAATSSARFLLAKPFPHLILDEFLNPALLDRVLAEFPCTSEQGWTTYKSSREIKLASASEKLFGSMTRLLLYHLNSVTFLDFLSTCTGLANLISDPSFHGGGLHQTVRGGKLAIHADFNKHPRYDLDRRLNLILYLNKNWREEYGGHLQFWDTGMTCCETRILPVFNRIVIFATSDATFHGHPDPLQCPESMTRKSIALYYFTNGRPAEESSSAHSSIFKARTRNEFGQDLKERCRNILRDCVPPIIARQIRFKRKGR